MKIGYTGPISLQMLEAYLAGYRSIPKGYLFPLGASLVREYIARGHHVSVFTLDKNLKAPQRIHSENLSVYVGSMRYPPVLRLVDGFRKEITFIREAIKSSDCDVIHAEWSYEFAYAAQQAHSKVLITANDAPGVVLKHMPELFRLARYLLTKKVVRNAEYMTAVSPYIASYYTDVLHYSNRMNVIPNGLPGHLISKCPRKHKSDGCFTVVCNTAWTSLKNTKNALRGFYIAQLQNPRLRLKVCGNNLGEHSRAHRWAIKNNLAKNVEFLGALEFEKLQSLLSSQVDACLHSSIEESFSMAVAECMAKGIPCIGGKNSGAIPWLLSFGEAGLLVDVLNPNEISAAILQLEKSPELYNQISQTAHHRLQSFLLKDIAGQYLKEMEYILKK